MTKDQFNLWKHDPVSKVFFGFLKDKRQFLIDTVSGMWVDGADVPPAIRGQVIELAEILELPFEAIDAFYQERDNNGTESESPVNPQG